MGKGRDLTAKERAMVYSKIKIYWDNEKKQIKHGKVFEIMKLSAKSDNEAAGMIINRRTIMAKDAGGRPELRSIFL